VREKFASTCVHIIELVLKCSKFTVFRLMFNEGSRNVLMIAFQATGPDLDYNASVCWRRNVDICKYFYYRAIWRFAF